MTQGIDDQAFNKITQEFLTAAKRDRLPDHLSRFVVELHRGPMSSTDAVVTWKRWLAALPGDPIGDLTVKDIRDLFQRSVDDLGRSQKALDEFSKLVLDPTNLPTYAEAARKADWQAYRTVIVDSVRREPSARESILTTLDTPMRLAEHGLMQDLFVENFRRFGAAFSEQTALLDELSHRGVEGAVL